MILKTLDHKKILYIKSESNYTWIHLQGITAIKYALTLKSLKPKIDCTLIEICKGIAINTDFLAAYRVHARGGFVEMVNGEIFSISRRRAATVKKALNPFKHLRLVPLQIPTPAKLWDATGEYFDQDPNQYD